MIKKSVFSVLALSAAMMVGACSSGVKNGMAEDMWGQPAPVGKTTLAVTNNSWQDMNVFLLRGATRIRLGMVTSMNTAHYTIPGDAVGNGDDLRLYADPIGSIEGWVTQPLLVNPGQEVNLTLQNNLNLSSYSIF